MQTPPCRPPCRPGSGASVPPAPSMWETVAKPRQLLYGHLWETWVRPWKASPGVSL